MTRSTRQTARPSSPTLAALLALLAALVVLPLALAPRAEAFIYWIHPTTNLESIARANLNGKDILEDFIPLHGEAAGDLALDATHIYWTSRDDIGRAKLDGTRIDRRFISGIDPLAVAVDKRHLYWAWSDCGPGTGACSTEELRTGPPAGIGRANLDGTHVEEEFISGIDAHDIAVDREYIYWSGWFCESASVCDTPWSGLPFPVQAIGRANLDGTGVDRGFISDVYGDLAVDSEHIYWAGGAAIGRANLDGTAVEPTLIGGYTGDHAPVWDGIAVDRAHIYWTDHGYFESTIDRANLDGTGVESFINTSEDFPFGALAVDGRSDARIRAKATAKRTQRQKGKKIRVKVRVKAKQRLTARATGKVEINPTYKLRPKTMKVAKGRAKILKLKPKNKAQAKKIAAALKRGEKATAKVKVKLTNRAGNTETEKLRVRLKR